MRSSVDARSRTAIESRLRSLPAFWRTVREIPEKMKTKNAPDNKHCQGRANTNDPRCHLVSWKVHALCRILTYPWQLTYAIRYDILGLAKPFPRTLSGPFDNLRSVRLPPARTLWKCTTTVISASSVLIIDNLSQSQADVNNFFMT